MQQTDACTVPAFNGLNVLIMQKEQQLPFRWLFLCGSGQVTDPLKAKASLADKAEILVALPC